MATLTRETESYLAHFQELENELAGGGPDALLPLRRKAIARFTELGFPTTRDEEWKYTSVAPIARTRFQRAERGAGSGHSAIGTDRTDRSDRSDLPTLAPGAPRLVFLDGLYQPALSTLAPLPAGVTVSSLAAALKSDFARVEAHLARYARFDHHAFVALNTALMEDGAFIHVPRGVVIESPIHLLFHSSPGTEPIAAHPRILIVAEENSQATIIETYAGVQAFRRSGVQAFRSDHDTPTVTASERPNAQDHRFAAVPPERLNARTPEHPNTRTPERPAASFTNAVTEIVAAENAVLEHYKVQRESEAAFHIATLQIHQARDSSVTSHSFSLGGALVRNDIRVILDGPGGEATLNGLYLANGQQHVDYHTTIDHAKPHCDSHELYKGILDGHATAVFNGKIHVLPDAQKTDAKQTNQNLLLSRDAVINTKPQLEIFADDVRCTHGATVGQLDADAVFYLRSRAIGLAEARGLLTYAFANDILERIKVAPLRAELEVLLQEAVGGGQWIVGSEEVAGNAADQNLAVEHRKADQA